jgi:hypothetical protein
LRNKIVKVAVGSADIEGLGEAIAEFKGIDRYVVAESPYLMWFHAASTGFGSRSHEVSTTR